MNINTGDIMSSTAHQSALQDSASPRSRFPVKKLLLGGVALAVVILAFWRFTGMGDQRGGNQRRGQTAPVRVAEVVRQDMSVVEHTLGRAVSVANVQVTARVQGVLDSANFKEGQFVKKGDLLFEIDQRGFKASLDQARAILARDEAQLVNTQRDVQRYDALKDKGNVSVQQYDLTRTNAEMLVATVAADKAAVDLAELNISYAQIRSPVDGKTGPLLVQPGNLVVAGGTSPLVTIAQMKPIKISFTLPQTELPRIQARQRGKGLGATLDIHSADGKPLEAPVDFIDNAVNAQSGTIELRSTFGNEDLSLVPGQLVNVTVEMDKIENALVVPRDAVNDGPDGTYVYVVSDDKAVQHSAKVLFDDGQNVAIESDVKPGDKVIIEGQLRVLPNGPVNILPPRGAQAPDQPAG
jgi:membrane fusion protein, multidrug efflux system